MRVENFVPVDSVILRFVGFTKQSSSPLAVITILVSSTVLLTAAGRGGGWLGRWFA